MADQDDSSSGKPISLAEHKKRLRKAKPPAEAAPPKKRRLDAVEKYREMAWVINRDPLAAAKPPFGAAFHTLAPDARSGTRLVLKARPDDPEILDIVDEKTLANELVVYTNKTMMGLGYELTYRQALEAVDLWRAMTPPLDGVKPFRWLTETGWGFQRLPWDPSVDDTGERTATWGSLLARMTNAEAFIAFVGSLFFEQADRQQYCYLYGAGNDGKGAISRFFKQCFGSAYAALDPPERGDRFWNVALLGKRLVVLSEVDEDFAGSSRFKQLTGGDLLPMEIKNGARFTSQITAKFLTMSNVKPDLELKTSDLRRIILCSFTPRAAGNDDATFEQRLWAEGGAFLGTCMARYGEDYATHLPIACDVAEITDHMESVAEPFAVALAGYFEPLDPRRPWDSPRERALLPATAWEQSISPAVYQGILERAFKTRTEREGFTRWLRNSYGIESRSHVFHDGKRKVYLGLRRKAWDAPQGDWER